MARIVTRALPLASRSSHLLQSPISTWSLPSQPLRSPISSLSSSLSPISSHISTGSFDSLRRRNHVSVGLRGFRKTRRPQAPKRKSRPKEKKLELEVKICVEEGLPCDPQVMKISEILADDVPLAMKVAFDGLSNSEYKTRDTSISEVGRFDNAELSLLLCNDDFMQKLNKDWRGVDAATDVLSMSQHIPLLDTPTLMLGDIVISVETAARQAEERGHSLLDESRILMVHGLLHLLGFDHEISEEAEIEMQKEEEHVLKGLGWKGKGLIASACDDTTKEGPDV
ncbi:uncharacterized protein LOC109847162 [Asparagus officinalis]|uniref:uncharacterized protein LOC109847162 n=1 Tax=Asparagus officinalis TaxID=4686 RepID=UPI00098E38F2|nr:uncharacterized protein LOC109847162 [Asparagus officinalis]